MENPAWPEYIEIDERGVLKLSVDDAVRLALLRSRLSTAGRNAVSIRALDVSVERFRFDSQFFAGYSVFGTFTGPGRTGNSSSVLGRDIYPRAGWHR